MPFKPGEVSNPEGRNGRQFKAALTLAVKRADGDKTKLAQIAEALVAKAVAGDVPAIKEVADRLDGKATQVIAGDGENPLISFDGLRDILGAKLARIADEKPAGTPEG